jgi:hypothetical protein
MQPLYRHATSDNTEEKVKDAHPRIIGVSSRGRDRALYTHQCGNVMGTSLECMGQTPYEFDALVVRAVRNRHSYAVWSLEVAGPTPQSKRAFPKHASNNHPRIS